MAKAVLVNLKDNVVTAVTDVRDSEEVTYEAGSELRQIKTQEVVPFGNKIAISRIAKGGDIIKYGETIGRAATDINAGQWVHSHNTQETYVPSR